MASTTKEQREELRREYHRADHVLVKDELLFALLADAERLEACEEENRELRARLDAAGTTGITRMKR